MRITREIRKTTLANPNTRRRNICTGVKLRVPTMPACVVGVLRSAMRLPSPSDSAPDDTRTSLLWNLVTWENQAAEARREFHVGPLFSSRTVGDEKRIAIGNGLFGFKREGAGAGWRMFWLDFRGKSATTIPSAP